ncbi:NUDIX domain-containing protein [Oceanobacillus halotolerans]|uniref:NUDIX domain-containing protein n=1 Tax=Oceanobacillus halotolerans TaxID=2663380 RepID=UPI0013DC4CC9|nr:8-oxo-dGTP diphosphatase [Oceanobacillus halotolerans]
MQRVTNCILIENNHVLLLQKPRRGWYAIPGGKMEHGETIKESVVREFWEETALQLVEPKLGGTFTFNIMDGGKLVQEWMMFTFICRTYQGTLTDHCDEGELEWVPIERISKLPMAEGDRKIFRHLLTSSSMLFGAFTYTESYELLEARMDPSSN